MHEESVDAYEKKIIQDALKTTKRESLSRSHRTEHDGANSELQNQEIRN